LEFQNLQLNQISFLCTCKCGVYIYTVLSAVVLQIQRDRCTE